MPAPLPRNLHRPRNHRRQNHPRRQTPRPRTRPGQRAASMPTVQRTQSPHSRQTTTRAPMTSTRGHGDRTSLTFVSVQVAGVSKLGELCLTRADGATTIRCATLFRYQHRKHLTTGSPASPTRDRPPQPRGNTRPARPSHKQQHRPASACLLACLPAAPPGNTHGRRCISAAHAPFQ